MGDFQHLVLIGVVATPPQLREEPPEEPELCFKLVIPQGCGAPEVEELPAVIRGAAARLAADRLGQGLLVLVVGGLEPGPVDRRGAAKLCLAVRRWDAADPLSGLRGTQAA